MKKLMIAAAIVCAAAMSQGASLQWSTATKLVGVDITKVGDNGTYAVDANGLRNASSLTYVLTLTNASGTEFKFGPSTFNIAGSGKVSQTINLGEDFVAGTYSWTLLISGTQDSLTAKTSPDYDYTNAKIDQTLSGTGLAINGAGQTAFGTAAPSTWNVTGVVAIPEPTSGLLLLLGVAGLALRRRRA